MDVSEIKFCNKTAFNIKNNREKSNIIKYIYDTYHLSINKSYFKFYNDSYLQNITKNEYSHIIGGGVKIPRRESRRL